MNLNVSIRQHGDVTLVDVAGHLTSFESGALRDAIQDLLAQGRKRIVLNLSRLTYLDSSGVGQLARNYLSVVKAGGEMRAVGLSSRIQEILRITQLHQVFPDFGSEEDALRSFPQERSGNAKLAMMPARNEKKGPKKERSS
jgi:anti-sigma B factor antagonist